MIGFENLILDTLKEELTPARFQMHPSTDTLLSLLAGELPWTMQQRLFAHLALCSHCQERYARLQQCLEEEQKSIVASIPLGAFSSFFATLPSSCRKKGCFVHAIRKRLCGRKPALAGLTIAIAVVGTCLALLLPPALQHWRGEPQPPLAGGAMVARGTPISNAGWENHPDLTPESFVQRLEEMKDYEPWRAIAFTIGYLHAEGVPLGDDSLAFKHQTTYVVREGDTWGAVAQQALGNEELWPIIILLNHDRTVNGEIPPPGTILRVPIPIE
jgi:nucleoid-associated protein YgaU